MTRKRLLRPMDIAWQAYLFAAGPITLADLERHNSKFLAWWANHPQTKRNGELK